MFGHLKAEDFINILDGVALSERKNAHFEHCERCRHTLKAADGMRARVARLSAESDENLPEPDWSEFRTTIRDSLLSRAIQRETTQRRWSGRAWKPAMVWSLSAMFVLGLTTGLFVWNKSGAVEEDLALPAAEIQPFIDGEGFVDIHMWASRDAFEELARLEADEAAVLGDLLQGASNVNTGGNQ